MKAYLSCFRMLIMYANVKKNPYNVIVNFLFGNPFGKDLQYLTSIRLQYYMNLPDV